MVALLHYHLGPGGVASVLAAQSRAMSRAGVPHMIFCGLPILPEYADLPIHVCPELGYDDQPITALDWPKAARKTIETMRRQAIATLGAPPTIWHAHNAALARHPLLPHVVAQLATEHAQLWLHLHDLAEDGRPHYLAALGPWRKLYPIGPHVRYRFLNQRDRHRLVQAGLPKAAAHVIPNPPAVPSAAPGTDTTHISGPTTRWLLYPVRAIRRKNLAEVLLLATLLPKHWRIAVSQAPTESSALRRYHTWRTLAEQWQLPIEFEVVGRLTPHPKLGTSFADWCDASSCWLTTSVEEGFGMVFADAKSHRKPLIGRLLDHVGPQTDGHALYREISIPSAWCDQHQLALWAEQVWWSLLQSHGLRTNQPPRRASQRLAMLHKYLQQQEALDFGNLPEPIQVTILETLITQPASREAPLVQLDRSRPHTTRQTLPLWSWLHEHLRRCEEMPPRAIRQPPGSLPTSPTDGSDSVWHALQAAEAIPLPPRVKRKSLSWLSASRVLDQCLWPMSNHSTAWPFRFLTAPALDEGNFPDVREADAVIFDVYGTLLLAPPGGVRSDPSIDAALQAELRTLGYPALEAPSRQLAEEVKRLHLRSPQAFPEIDLRAVWRKVLNVKVPIETLETLVIRTEAIWHPSTPMPGAFERVRDLHERGIRLGILSNAQCNTPHELGELMACFDPNLTILSYLHGCAKPDPTIFKVLIDRLRQRGLSPNRCWLVGNDPIADISAARAHGFQTALFTGHPSSLRPGWSLPTHRFAHW